MRRVHQRVLVWFLAVTMVASPLWAYAAQPAAATVSDMSYVTPGAVLLAVAHPRRLLAAPEMEMMPIEVLSAAGKKEFGIDPMDVEQVMTIVEPPMAGPPGFGVVVRFVTPHRLETLKLPPNLRLTDTQLDGRPYRQAQPPTAPGWYMPDDRTLLVAPDAVLKRMLANRKNPQQGPLSRLMAQTDTSADFTAIAVVKPIRPMLSAGLAQAPLPPQFQSVQRLPELIDAAKVELGASSVSLVLLSPDEAAAEQLDNLLNGLLDTGQQMALAEIASEAASDDPVEQAGALYAQRIMPRIFDMFRPQRTGKMLRLKQEGETHSQVATAGILVALLLPAVQAAREAARRAQSTNNLKQIALAMLMCHEAKGEFPARANFDAQGKPLLSWRVHILPYLEQKALYEQFHLDEPWDSEHNKQLIDQMPAVYRNPSSPAPQGKANYLVPVGEGSIFEGRQGTPMAKITDGTANTILVVEADTDAAVIWTKPDDLQYDREHPLAGLGNAHPGGFAAALADGSVHFISGSIDPQLFLRLLMMADGEPVGRF